MLRWHTQSNEHKPIRNQAMRIAAISLNVLLLLTAMVIVLEGKGLNTQGVIYVSIMFISGAVSLLAFYIDAANSADSDRIKSLKQSVKEAELEKQLNDLKGG